MVGKVVLFDTENTLIREWKDVSQYYVEAIRNSYGLTVEVELQKYEGFTVQETVYGILSKNGLSDDEIKAKLELFLQELPYAHYNVAGHDKAILVDGAKDLLSYLKGRDYVIGSASGQMERILRNMFERAGLDYDSYFKLGAYGDSGMHISDVIGVAIGKAKDEFSADKDQLTFISNSKAHVDAARRLGINAIGVITGAHSREDFGGEPVAKGLNDCRRFLK
ncbi:MAG: HAD hydrolase-like protein [Candidatus Micrarchaeota archaeon]|nr:HAD hydrolase-like protein [Candidatus Micrarchaeota archaeon]